MVMSSRPIVLRARKITSLVAQPLHADSRLRPGSVLAKVWTPKASAWRKPSLAARGCVATRAACDTNDFMVGSRDVVEVSSSAAMALAAGVERVVAATRSGVEGFGVLATESPEVHAVVAAAIAKSSAGDAANMTATAAVASLIFRMFAYVFSWFLW